VETIMKYAMLITGDEEVMNRLPADGGPISPEFVAYTDAMVKAGILVGGERLKSTASGRRVRVRDGKAVVLEGPYAEAREQLGGFFIIDVPTEAEALDWARRCPAALQGTVEVRPILASSPVANSVRGR
jgi:hypothetical protein